MDWRKATATGGKCISVLGFGATFIRRLTVNSNVCMGMHELFDHTSPAVDIT